MACGDDPEPVDVEWREVLCVLEGTECVAQWELLDVLSYNLWVPSFFSMLDDDDFGADALLNPIQMLLWMLAQT